MWNLKVKRPFALSLMLVIAGFVCETGFSQGTRARSESQQQEAKNQADNSEVWKKINALEELRKAGLLTDEEYRSKRRQLESQRTASDPEASKKIKALDELHKAGLLTDEEYESKKHQLQSQEKVSASAADDDEDKDDRDGVRGSYRAPDGSFSCMLPQGWNAVKGENPHNTFLEPPSNSGGQQFVMISTGTVDPPASEERGVRGVVQHEANIVSKNHPTLEGQARFFKINGHEAAELSFTGRNSNTDDRAWSGILMRDSSYYIVLAISTSGRAETFLAQAKAIFESLRPGSVSDDEEEASDSSDFGAFRSGSVSNNPRQTGDRSLAAALVGTWSYYHGSGTMSGRGSVSRYMTFYPNGTFEYQSSVDVSASGAGLANSEQTIRGTYEVPDTNTLILTTQDGQRAVDRIQLEQQGGYVQAIVVNGEMWIREQ